MTPEGIMPCYVVESKAFKDGVPTLLMLMDGLGYRDTLVDMADDMAACGYRVLPPDLYYRHGAITPINVAAAFAPGAEQDRMMALYASLSVPMVMGDIAGLIAAFDLHDVAIGCFGYCMGGGFVVAAAIAYPSQIRAAASIHAGGIVTAGENSLHRRLTAVSSKLYFGHAGIDPYFSAADAGALAQALYEAGVDHVTETYPGAHHGFAVPDTPVHDPAMAARSRVRLKAFFAEAFPRADTL